MFRIDKLCPFSHMFRLTTLPLHTLAFLLYRTYDASDGRTNTHTLTHWAQYCFVFCGYTTCGRKEVMIWARRCVMSTCWLTHSSGRHPNIPLLSGPVGMHICAYARTHTHASTLNLHTSTQGIYIARSWSLRLDRINSYIGIVMRV